MVVIVTSRARSLHNPTQQDCIHARTYPYIIVTCVSSSEELSRVHYVK